MFDPFLPDAIERSYEKVNKRTRERINISEDLTGLLNYLTSLNIRHKVPLILHFNFFIKTLNPLFLFFKFPKAVKLYYNSSLITTGTTDLVNFISLKKRKKIIH